MSTPVSQDEIDAFFGDDEQEDLLGSASVDEEEEKRYRRYGKEEKLRLYDQMLELKNRKRMSWDEIAAHFKVARSTIRDWRATDEWRLSEARWRRIMREEQRSDATMMGQDALGVLHDLMHNSRSDFTRYSAAAKIIDVVGIGDEAIENLADQTSDLKQWLEANIRRRASRDELLRAGGLSGPEDLLALEVQPGGMLPEAITKMNEQMAETRLKEREAVEAEFRVMDEEKH